MEKGRRSGWGTFLTLFFAGGLWANSGAASEREVLRVCPLHMHRLEVVAIPFEASPILPYLFTHAGDSPSAYCLDKISEFPFAADDPVNSCYSSFLFVGGGRMLACPECTAARSAYLLKGRGAMLPRLTSNYRIDPSVHTVTVVANDATAAPVCPAGHPAR